MIGVLANRVDRVRIVFIFTPLGAGVCVDRIVVIHFVFLRFEFRVFGRIKTEKWRGTASGTEYRRRLE